MKKKRFKSLLSILLVISMIVVVYEPMDRQAVAESGTSTITEVSTLAELKLALDDDKITEIIVSNTIVLEAGEDITIDGKHKTVRVPVTGTDAVGVANENPSAFCVFAVSKYAKVSISNMTILGGKGYHPEESFEYYGGAIYNKGTLNLEEVNIKQSGSKQSQGGGLFNTGSGIMILKKCNVMRNIAKVAGGFYNGGDILILDSCSVTENRNISEDNMGGGGGETARRLYAVNTTFANNQSTEIGGALNICGGNSYILNCSITGNLTTKETANYGGGIGISSLDDVYIINSVIADNYCNAKGVNTQKSDIGIYEKEYFGYAGEKTYVYNSLYEILDKGDYGKIGGNDNNWVGQNYMNNLFTDYADSPLLNSDGMVAENALSFSRPKLINAAAYLSDDSKAKNGGTNIYFHYDYESGVRIGYDAGGTFQKIIGVFDEEKKDEDRITLYQDGEQRADGVIGAVGVKTIKYHTVKALPSTGGSFTGATIFGDTYKDTESVTITAEADTGYTFVRWEKEDGTLLSNNPRFTFSVTEDVTLKPIFVKVEFSVGAGKDYPTFVKAVEAAMASAASDSTQSYKITIYEDVTWGGGTLPECEKLTIQSANGGSVDNNKMLTITSDVITQSPVIWDNIKLNISSDVTVKGDFTTTDTSKIMILGGTLTIDGEINRPLMIDLTNRTLNDIVLKAKNTSTGVVTPVNLGTGLGLSKTTNGSNYEWKVIKAALTGSVSITGTEKYGSVLTADVSGITSSNPGTYTYQWKRNGLTEIGTGNTYTLTAADIGSSITVTVTAANCSGSLTSDATAAVGKVELTVNVTVNDKPYDGTNTATINTASLVGVKTGDIVTLTNGTPTFASVGIGNNIAISFTNFSISGANANNYTLVQPAGVKANIIKGFTSQNGKHYITTTLTNGWVRTGFVISAMSGYKLSVTNTADSTWSNSLTYSTETNSGSVNFYVKNITTGEISVMATENYKIDKTAPIITGVTDGSIYYTDKVITVTDTNLDTITVNGDAFTSGSVLAGDKNVTYIIVATDKAGNSTKVTVTMKTIASLSENIKDITVGNVKSTDKAKIEAVDVALKSVDITNATPTQKDQITVAIQNCTDLLKVLSNIGKVQKEVIKDGKVPETSFNNNLSKLKSFIITEEEKQLVESGVDIKIYLQVKDISEIVNSKDKEIINTSISDYQVGDYIDISLFKKVGDNEAVKISNPNGLINITLIIPEHLKSNKASVERSYNIVRVHNGEMTIIDGKYNAQTGEFTFETDKFSTYAIIYKDVITNVGVETGDMTPIWLWSTLMLLSVIVITVNEFFWKKKKKEILKGCSS